ncbi:MAG TPA: hypothetical protein V6D20_23895 [Candidatus Obscuribacterales bacterium]
MKSKTAKTVTLRKDFIRCWIHAKPEVSKKDAGELYDALQKKFPEITRGGHRGMVGRLQPWEALEHECPYCGKVAKGIFEIDELIGLRHYKARGRVYYQSWCHSCRAAGHKKDASDPTFNVRINPIVEAIHTN